MYSLSDAAGQAKSSQTKAGQQKHNRLKPGPSNRKPTITKRPPPIMVKQGSLSVLMKELEAAKIDATFQICRAGVKIITELKSAHEAAIGYLQGKKLQFYTHDFKADKPFKSVVKGLPAMDPNEIMVELANRYKLQPLAVYPMRRKDDTVKDYQDRFYLVHFEKGTVTANALQAVRVINKIRCRWEPYRNTRNDTQCQRCLEFSHGTRNCHCKPRCANCAQTHLTADCLLESSTEFKCANCKANHRGNNRSCPKRAEFIASRRAAITSNQSGKKTKTTPPPPEDNNKNFPPLSRGSTTTLGTPTGIATGPAASRITNELPGSSAWTKPLPITPRSRVADTQVCEPESEVNISELLPDKFSMDKLMQIFDEMITALQKCTCRQEQIRVLGHFIIKYGC
jgi:hypothetical protein